MDEQQPQLAYKPNIYPIMYWAILYGAVAALALVLLTMIAKYVTILWFPVFLAGLVWGGFRKYKQDKATWMKGKGLVGTSKSPLEEFKDAARDITQASQDMMRRQAQEDAAAQQAAQAEVEQEQVVTEEAPQEQPAAPVVPQAAPQPQEQEQILTSEEEPPTQQQPPVV